MHIGLIGGIGPAGTISYYRHLADLHTSAGRAMRLTIAHAELRDLVANIAAGDTAAQAAIFARHADELRRGGCEAVAIGAIGGHFCIDAFAAASSLPVLSAIDALTRFFRAGGFTRVGVLGVRPVMESRVFGVSGAAIVVPPPGEIERVHACYVALASAGAATPAQRAYLHEAARSLCREGAEAVLLGGVDLSVAFDGEIDGRPVLDSAAIHAAAIAQHAMAG